MSELICFASLTIYNDLEEVILRPRRHRTKMLHMRIGTTSK